MDRRYKITHSAAAAFAALVLTAAVSAQKGVDTQTEKIKAEANKVTTRENDVKREFDWGKGKTKVRTLLPNPYKLTVRRDVLLNSIVDALREKKIVVDDASSRMRDGIVVTQPYVFAKGAVTSQNELNHYALLDGPDAAWTRGQYTLTIEVQALDGMHSNVAVIAKVEGRANNGLMSEWQTLRSSGVAEDEFLSKLIELVTGISPEPVNEKAP
jgi:hypothetical protein